MSLTCIDLVLGLALQAADDPYSCATLGDAILEVFARAEFDLDPKKQEEAKAAADVLGSPEFASKVFSLYGRIDPPIKAREWTAQGLKNISTFLVDTATSITPTLARALAAVLLCRDWQTAPWWTKMQQRLYTASSVRVFINGQEFAEAENVTVVPVVTFAEGRISAQIPLSGMVFSDDDG